MSSPNRGERRRAERQSKRKHAALIVGDNVVGRSLGHQYEAVESAKLPAKVRGVHRWIVTAAWVASPELIATVSDPSIPKLMDQENMLSFAIGCADCEQAWSTDTMAQPCPSTEQEDWR